MIDHLMLTPRMQVLLGMAKSALAKTAFVPTGGAEGGMPMGADPMAAGGAVPPGMDPAAMGGAPPPPPPPGDPAAMGGGGMDPMAAMAATGAGDGGLQQMVQQAVQQALAGGAGGAGAGQIKPKIDIPTELMQIKQMLAKLVDASGIQLSAESMVATPEKLTESLAQAPTKAAKEEYSPMWAKAAGLLAVIRARKEV